MLKKIIAIILTISTLLALGACSHPAEDTTVSTESEVVTTIDTTEEATTEAETEAAETKSIDLTGTFIPTNYADKEYTSIPHITFFGDENCIMYFPLKEGACQFNGKYSVVDNTWIKIKLDLSESEFKGYVPEEFEFAGGTNNHFMLTSTGFSGIALGDKFKRVTQEELSELGITIEDTEEVNVNASPFIDGVEPLLTEIVLSKSVPDFLDEEQQILYRKAFSLIYYRSVPTYRSMEFADSLNYYIGKYNIIKPYGDNSGNYRISQGRYQNWEDFIALLHSVFTEEFASEAFYLNSPRSSYYNYNGKLAEIDASGIWNKDYNPNFKDKFELISKTDSEIVFNLIGHYSSFYPKEGETNEERKARIETSWEWTQEFTIRMVMTESGWRFDEFHVAPLESSSTDNYITAQNKEVDVAGFINLDRHIEDGDSSPYLTKDEILAFDKQAKYIGPVPEHSYSYTNFTMFITSEDRSMFGHNGFLYYPAKVDYSEVIENTEDYPHEFYSECYKYTGDGSDIPFGSDMVFAIQNATYNDYVDVMSKVAEFTHKDISDIKVISNHRYIKIADVPGVLAIDDNDTVVKNELFYISSQALSVPDCADLPFEIKVDFLSEKRFSGKNRAYKEIFPSDGDVYNRIVIRIYQHSDRPEPKSSEHYLTGKYVYKDGGYADNPSAPCLYLDSDGDCIMLVNYLEGGFDTEGKYYIQGDKLYAEFSFANTIFEDTDDEYREREYMSKSYVFTIIDDRITIDRHCYVLNAGDSLYRVPELISDEEAIELFEIAEYTSMQWLSFDIDPQKSTDADPIYREYTDSKLIAYYPLTKESHAYMDTPDIRGNTKIYYGDHDWMEENLRKIFTEKYIEKYFSYGYPSPLIYENGIVYSMPASSQSVSTARTKTYENPTVIHKTEDELAIICEVYSSDPVTHKLDYSKIDGLAYMKLVKSNVAWLIDEHYSAKTGSVKTGIIMPKDLIPTEYIENIPEKYRGMTSYFEGYEKDNESGVHKVNIEGFDDLNWRIDGGDGKQYVTKDEILEFDKNAVFIGPDLSFMQYGDKYSSFEIMSTNCTLWGKECFVTYSGRIRADSKYITEEENALYGIAYMYNGDGSDILFDPKMIITVPNITYNDFIYVLENISELTDVDFESFFDTNLNQKMQRIRDAYTDNTIFIDTGEPIWFAIGGGKITIEIFGGQELKGAQSDALNDNPLTMRVYNMMKIHIN